jgi:hypothetical protein
LNVCFIKRIYRQKNLILNKHVIFNFKTFFWKFMELLSLLICHSTMTALTQYYIIFRNVETPNKYKKKIPKNKILWRKIENLLDSPILKLHVCFLLLQNSISSQESEPNNPWKFNKHYGTRWCLSVHHLLGCIGIHKQSVFGLGVVDWICKFLTKYIVYEAHLSKT